MDSQWEQWRDNKLGEIMEWLNILVGPILSLTIVIIGGSIVFGKFKEKSLNSEKEIVKLGISLSKMEDNLRNINGISTIECDKRSGVYKTLMCNKIDSLEKAFIKSSEVAEKSRGELSRQITKNRDEVLSKYNSFSVFVGETKAIMDLLKSKFLEEGS